MIPLTSTTMPTFLLLAAGVSSCVLGAFVLFNNPWRRTHRVFAALSMNLTLWAFGVLAIVHCRSQSSALFWLTATFMVACFLPATFYHFICVFPHQRFEGSRRALAAFYVTAGVLAALSSVSPWYIQDLKVFPDHPPVAEYGFVFFAYSGLISVCLVVAIKSLIFKVRQSTGIQRRQVEHVLISLVGTTVLASATNVFAPVVNIGNLQHYGPCFVVLMIAGLAYSMVRYHLLDVWFIISRTTVYAIVTGFVIATFLGTVSLVHWAFSHGGRAGDLLTTTLAALVIVVVLQPLKERVQLILDRIVLHRRYDGKALIDRISRMAARFVQLDQLLARVADEIKYTFGVRLIRIQLICEKEPDVVVAEYSTNPEEIGRRNGDLSLLIEYIGQHPEPIVLEEVLHGRPTRERMRLAETLAELDAWLLVPLRTTSGIVGFITLGEKTTRDIYVHEDVQVFATVSVALASAIENARLYRKLKEVNLHLERIMDSMRGGVVAVDASGMITTINEEALDMLGRVRPGMDLDALESKVAELLRGTLREKRGIKDAEAIILRPDGESIPVAMSSSYFDTPEQESLGAMVLIYNMMQLKRLESNVQRADRLTSIGTMAAGMAHEVKNPLQSIKTFTQLLPSRFEDPDFRKTFCEVVPPEVQRIDTIVTRLLDFARTKPVHFAPLDPRRIIEEVLMLVENQVRKAGIRVSTEFPSEPVEINADDQRLHQVVLNLILNAIDAMKDNPVRNLTFRMTLDRAHLTSKGQPTFFDVPCVRIAVSDTGCGISKDHIDQLFTPFFTTKADGSGLGLSVVHGIVTEHGGEIDVDSAPGLGTTFTLTFPLKAGAEALERVGV